MPRWPRCSRSARAASTAALQGSKITATVLGGDGDAAVQTVLGIEQLLSFITEGGNYSADSPGVPIAYQLAYLDNGPARLALTAEYPERGGSDPEPARRARKSQKLALGCVRSTHPTKSALRRRPPPPIAHC